MKFRFLIVVTMLCFSKIFLCHNDGTDDIAYFFPVIN